MPKEMQVWWLEIDALARTFPVSQRGMEVWFEPMMDGKESWYDIGVQGRGTCRARGFMPIDRACQHFLPRFARVRADRPRPKRPGKDPEGKRCERASRQGVHPAGDLSPIASTAYWGRRDAEAGSDLQDLLPHH